MALDYPDFHSKGTPKCQTVDDPDMFFPEPYGKGSGALSARAKDVCKGCPYIQECLIWALERDEPGVWGGTSENERRRMKRNAVKNRVRGSLYS